MKGAEFSPGSRRGSKYKRICSTCSMIWRNLRSVLKRIQAYGLRVEGPEGYFRLRDSWAFRGVTCEKNLPYLTVPFRTLLKLAGLAGGGGSKSDVEGMGSKIIGFSGF